jgi:CRP-like cAMP-binding protein
MATRVDPEIANLLSENVGARKVYVEPIPPQAVTPTIRLDQQIIKKIADRVAIFAHLPQDGLLAALALGEVQHYRAGDVLFREKDLGRSFYVVIVGAVDVVKEREGRAVRVASLGVGECFGEMALVRDDLRTATVLAQVDCVTLCFQRARIDAYASIASVIYKNIAGVLARRLDERNSSMADRMVQDSPGDQPPR